MFNWKASRKPAIHTVESLQEHLWAACKVEMSTIPLYLYSMYSLQSQVTQQLGPEASQSGTVSTPLSAYRTIRSVVIEEMLHLTMARNLLWAVTPTLEQEKFKCYPRNGSPIYFPRTLKEQEDRGLAPGKTGFLPPYPHEMYFHKPRLRLDLRRCSVDQMRDTFMPLEQPEKSHAAPETGPYHTISQFYEAVEAGFRWLNEHHPEKLWGDPKERQRRAQLQLGEGDVYWNQAGGGNVFRVGGYFAGQVVDGKGCPLTEKEADHKNLESALEAMQMIIEQGEGAKGDTVPLSTSDKDAAAGKWGPSDPTGLQSEYSHWEKFKRIAEKIDPMGPVWPLMENPTLDQYSGSLRELAELFNACFCYVLLIIDEIYITPSQPLEAGQRNREWQLIQALLTGMGALLYPIADLIVRQPSGINGYHAGPTFEYYSFKTGDPHQELLAFCGQLAQQYPRLGGDDSVYGFLKKLPSVGL